jgi:signal transduction histidine kinase
MSALVTDLLNLTRTRLGSSIPIVLAPTNLRDVCESVIEEVSAAHPGKHLEVTYEGNLGGDWDSVKLGQVVSNLVANAIEHGAQREPVVLTVRGEDDRMSVAVHNEGAPIAATTLENIRNPLAGRGLEERGTSSRVKLGLFIAREILAAHGGTLQATSSPSTGTTFTASWPRQMSSGARSPTT